MLGKRWGDDPLQSHIEANTGHEVPWTSVAQERDQWSAMEVIFAGKALRRSPRRQLPRTRWMMKEDDNAQDSAARAGKMVSGRIVRIASSGRMRSFSVCSDTQ